MKFNPDIHKRKSIRLKNYDYSQEGLYFITISIKDKLCLFGEIKNNKLKLFDSGKMIEKYWLELENKFDNVKLHDFIIMPNHFHGVIKIIENNKTCNCKICRGTPYGYPNNNDKKIKLKKYNNNILKNYFNINDRCNIDGNQGTHKGYPYGRNLIGNIIGGFKSMTTNTYIQNVNKNNWNPFNKKLWQKNYYDHIVRNEESYFKIIDYINTNPQKWNEDKFYYTEI